MTNDERWLTIYNALKAYILERGHLPDMENRALLSWAKYQRKKIKEGALDKEKRRLFIELMLFKGATSTLVVARRILNALVSRKWKKLNKL